MLPEIKKCADNGDIRGLRYIFDDCLDVDPTFEKYKDGWEYCQKVNGLIEAHKELTPFDSNPSKWNEDYWVKLKSDLMKNFSSERFEHMITVAKIYYADKIKRLEAERSSAIKKDVAKPFSSTTISSTIKSTQQSIADSEARINADRQQREINDAQINAQKQAQRDAEHDKEKRGREEARERKVKEEATKKIVGVAVTAIIITVVAIILLTK